MKIHGLDLDNSPYVAQDKSLRYAENIAIGEGNQSYVNEDGFALKLDLNESLKNIFNIENNITIIGTIPTNIGVVLFAIYGDYHCIIYIKTDIVDNNGYNIIDRIIYSEQEDNSLNFNSSRPIHGDYIYNYKNELVITFTEGISEEANETRIINLSDPDGCFEPITINDNCKIYNIANVSMFNLIPNIEYPTLNIQVEEGGNIKTGAYQIAISYKLKDGSYTNYSILSTPIIVCGDYGTDIKPNTEINKKLHIQFDNAEGNNYSQYKLAIVHITDTGQLCYETTDLNISSVNNYYIIQLTNYQSITLDDIFIKNISYIKETTLVNYNNRLLRANVKTIDYKKKYNDKTIDELLKDFSETNVKCYSTAIEEDIIINTGISYFKTNEIYVPYIGYLDYKGDLINIYNIHNGCNKSFGSIKGIQIPQEEAIGFRDPYEKIQKHQFVATRLGNNYCSSLINLKLPDSFIIKCDPNIKSDSITIKTDKIDLVGLGDYAKGVSLTELYGLQLNYGDSISIDIHDNQTKLIRNDGESLITKGNIHWFLYEVDNKIANEGYDPNPDDDELVINLDYVFKTDVLTDLNLLDYTISTDGKYKYTNNHKNTLQKFNHYVILIAIYEPTENHKFISFDYIEENISDFKFNYLRYKPQTLHCEIINHDSLPPELKHIIKSVCYFYIEHNLYNSNVISQGLLFPDTDVNNYNTSIQKYEGQFAGNKTLRFYPFEYLYNIVFNLEGTIKPIRSIGDFKANEDKGDSIIVGNFKIDRSYAVLTPDSEGFISDKSQIDSDGIKILDCDYNQVFEYSNSELIKDVKMEYIQSDLTPLQNIAGDSFYRILNKNKKDLTVESTSGFCIADLINTSENLYSDSDTQILQIASNIMKFENGITDLKGDFYLNYLTLRLTTPSKHFAYGISDNASVDSNNTVYRWVLTFPIESRFNLLGRYGGNSVNKPYFLHNGDVNTYMELLALPYKTDNFINTSVGKGYNTIYNENGIEQFTYYDEIPGVSNHPHRVIRSLPQNTESTTLNWRIFKTDDYKDLPFNRGEIISLKTDNKNLYIQQKYGLHILQQRDQLNNNEAGDSYLGTSDLFNMEPKEVIYSPSGYIGCENYFDTDVNVNGYVVIDVVHKKVFLVNGDKPLEISNIKTKDFFDKFLSNESDVKRIINYSEDKNILYITQSNSDIEKTMSFSPLNKVWVSFHSYIPDLGFVNRNGLFWGENGKLYSPTLNDNKGKFFTNDAKPSIIQFILNENTMFNKLLKTIIWKDQVTCKSDNYIQHFFKETINHIMIHNDYQCSGIQDVNGSYNINTLKNWWDGSKGTNKVNIWRFNKFIDLVLPDHTSNFMTNAITPNSDSLRVNWKWYEVNRFICQFIYLTMWCDNTQSNHEWELIDINPEYALDNRNDQTYNYQDNNKKQS